MTQLTGRWLTLSMLECCYNKKILFLPRTSNSYNDGYVIIFGCEKKNYAQHMYEVTYGHEIVWNTEFFWGRTNEIRTEWINCILHSRYVQ